MSTERNRAQYVGARLMLETLALKFSWPDRLIDICWDAYVKRLRAERIAHIEHELRQVRFCIACRAGRDADWIRSWTKYGCPPMHDDN